ncbi:MAG TPA: rRNA maturation RNase YbeY [Candidatus Krumholzibacteria bacterium]|nr:rRNA maturation RNase YbeY [Candidatus Krumholzibacteria bacterium]HPD71239.1 rRNA maturation RNase YbeY [Candidatus Krumholzibacteria bacterium]HRY39061.1 rRNA maturation RNase YbeY [Candidatus Krumholzibacteria bacterium]
MKCELVDQRVRPESLPLDATRLAALTGGLGRPDWVVNLVLVEDHVMADLYERWYGATGVTDVLSFAYLENAGAGEPDLASGDRLAARDLWVAPGEVAEPVTVGEVILAPAFIAARCRAEGWDLEAEWALLVAHGCLHVLGWEHARATARRAMRACEAALLAQIGIAHPLAAEGTED